MGSQLHSPEETKERFDKLPGAVQDLLYSPEMNFIVQQVGQKNQLHLDQIGTLSAEAGQVMLGYTSAEDFPASLAHGLVVDEEKAAAIAHDIDEQLFSKIRTAMGEPCAPIATPAAHKEAETPTFAPPPMAAAVPAPAPMPQSTPMVSMPSAAKPAPVPPAPAPQAPVTTASSEPKTPVPAALPVVKPAPAPVQPVATAPTSAPAPKPSPAANLVHEEAMLSGKKVSAAPAAKVDPAKPQNYKADPYREPVE